MPRPKNYILLDFLTKNDANEIVCNNGDCNSKILNSHSPNLERHLKKVHPDLYSNYVQRKYAKEKININLYSKNYVQQKCAHRKQNNSLKTETFPKDLNRANIELAIVELFTRNGRPMKMIEDRSFKILVQPVFDALGISVNEQNINERIIAFSLNLKKEFIKELKGKLLSLKIDAATRQDLSLLGINVQYIKNKCVQIKTLALKQLNSSHTSEYLTSVILDVLKEYEIDINQILTINTDHGDNMLKSVNAINADYQISLGQECVDYTLKKKTVDGSLAEDIIQSIRSTFSSYSQHKLDCGTHKPAQDINTDHPIFQEEENVSYTLKEEKIDYTMNEENGDDSLTEDIMQSIRSNFSSYSITGVRCGAHTLQLCVSDVIRNFEIKIKLENCRSVVNTLRTQTYLNILKNGNYKQPITDCVTSWSSTFDMLERLWEIKEIIRPLSAEDSCLYLSPDLWNFVAEFIEIFKPIYSATLKLQSEQLCFSELYIILMNISFQVEGLHSSEMATLLVTSLKKRKTELFDMDLFNAAVFLDPRIKICMNAEQKERAKMHITCIYKRINSLKETDTETIDCSIVKCENLEEEPSTSNRSLAKSFSEFLQNLDTGNSEPVSSSFSPLEADFIIYERQSRLALDSNIIDYWSVQNNTLSVIAHIILAIPTTQTSMERLFSALNYILSDQSNRLTAFNLEHLLMVKINGIFNYDN